VLDFLSGSTIVKTVAQLYQVLKFVFSKNKAVAKPSGTSDQGPLLDILWLFCLFTTVYTLNLY